MLRVTIVCLIALALQISALPEFIENLDRDLASLPEKYKHLAHEINTKRAANPDKDTHGYCCTNWQHINKDEVFSKLETSLVPETHTVVVGYQDCHGNKNPTRPPIPIPTATDRPINTGGQVTPSTGGGSASTASGCMWKPIYNTETFMVTQHTVVTYLVPNSQTSCAPEDYKCCPNYVLLNNNCVDQSVVANLEFLMGLGLIGNIGKK
ncbi:unnamed protein product [Rotaria socialis]|uniref:Uncharacterized protein n=1 Tax=Rotaria socialis TaxID=392032 RepID=A0A820N194_9BILA|nr:unnamed protein product [Rotaria socialis]CAF3311715.1 unnamed protein product [Rotaria socialis]CAF3325158.1 unnamed protein product [Rotaria socialis]CAF3418286.1 unnamed protein product [Rotaria socialis]CAF3640671.1 unnamed protein product [Rotaria socialis]